MIKTVISGIVLAAALTVATCVAPVHGAPAGKLAPLRLIRVSLHNNANAAIPKVTVESRFQFNDRAFSSDTVKQSGPLAAGVVYILTLEIPEPKAGVYHALVWHWARECSGSASIPETGTDFTTVTGAVCRNAGAKPGFSPYAAQVAEAVNEKYTGAAAAYKQKNYAVAIEYYKAALKIDPKHEQSLHFRGHSYLELGKTAQAIADFTAAIAVSKSPEHLYLDRAKAHKAAKNLDAVIADYTHAIAVDPSLSNYELRGKEYAVQKKYALAAADYTKLIAGLPKYANAYYWRGLMLLSLRKNEEAAADFTKVIELEPRSWKPHYELGWLLEKDLAGASAHFSKALELFSPADPSTKANILRGRGVIRVKLGDYAGAKSDFEQAILHDPKTSSAYFNLGLLFSVESNYAAAVVNYSKAIDLDPKEGRYLLQRAETYMKQGKAEMAGADIAAAIVANPASAKPYALRADILCSQGKKELAAADEAKVIALGGTLEEKCW